MPVEVTNVMYRRVVLRQVPMVTARQLVDAFFSIGIEFERTCRAVSGSDGAGCTQLQQDLVYDTHYLALAEMLDCELWTADERFYRAGSPFFRLMRWLGSLEQGASDARRCGREPDTLSPFEESPRHFRFSEDGITEEAVNERRTPSILV